MGQRLKSQANGSISRRPTPVETRVTRRRQWRLSTTSQVDSLNELDQETETGSEKKSRLKFETRRR